MPEVSYTTEVRAPVEATWNFVKDMDHWAPFIMGYQEHERIDDLDSIWTLKGDVGVLSRKVRFRVHITEWAGPSRVAFTMTGINEQLHGEGLFEMGRAAGDEAPTPAAQHKRTALDGLGRSVYRWIDGRSPTPQRPPPDPTGAAGERSRLVFRLTLKAGGMTGPVVDALIEPLLLPFAESLANRIAERVESGRSTAAPA